MRKWGVNIVRQCTSGSVPGASAAGVVPESVSVSHTSPGSEASPFAARADRGAETSEARAQIATASGATLPIAPDTIRMRALSNQLSIGAQMPDRGGELAALFVQAGGVVVRVGVAGVDGDGALVLFQRLVGAPLVLDGDRQVERRRGVVGAQRDRRTVVGLGLGDLTRFVQQATEVDVR